MKWMVPAVVAALAPSAMANGEDIKFHLEKNNKSNEDPCTDFFSLNTIFK